MRWVAIWGVCGVLPVRRKPPCSSNSSYRVSYSSATQLATGSPMWGWIEAAICGQNHWKYRVFGTATDAPSTPLSAIRRSAPDLAERPISLISPDNIPRDSRWLHGQLQSSGRRDGAATSAGNDCSTTLATRSSSSPHLAQGTRCSRVILSEIEVLLLWQPM